MLLQKSTEAKRIYCKILNAKANSDGYKEEGITFPSISGQRSLVSEVYNEIGLDPSTINYIEAHVTGTMAGDPVEMNAMYDVICTNKTTRNPLYIGCLKSNMGHTEGASGLCALAKACIIYQTRKIPPNLHFTSPNSNIRGLMDKKMIPVNQVLPFSGKHIPVNCFGFGGANIHVITESFDIPQIEMPESRITYPIPRLIQVCGRTCESVSYIFNKMSANQEEYLTPAFLSILSNFATIPYKQGMNYRGFAIAFDKGSKYNLICPSQPAKVKPKEVSLIFNDANDAIASSHDLNDFLREMKRINIFSESFTRLEKILALRYQVAGLNGNSNINYTRSQLKSHRFMQTVAAQIGIVNVLFALDIKVANIVAIGSGEIAAGYLDGVLSEEEAITTAYFSSLVVGQLNQLDSLARQLTEQIVLPKKYSRKMTSATSQYATGAYLAEKIIQSDHSQVAIPFDTLNFQVCLLDGLELYKRKGKLPADSACPSNVINNLLISLGQLYMNGYDCDVSKLYSPVKYPLPSSTATLSSLIKWNHSMTYPLSPFLVQSTNYYFQASRDLTFRFDRRNAEDAFLFDHKIDGRILFPATGYIMMAWIALAKLKKACIYDSPVEFTNVSFERATVMGEGETRLTIRVNDDNGYFAIKDGENLVAKGFVKFHNVSYHEPITTGLEPKPKNVITLQSKDIYRELRIRGYDYGQFFQGLSESRSDGRSGDLIWRDVLAKSFKDCMILETDEEQSLLWLRSWITFSDAMFQLLLMSTQEVSRNLFVPRKLESLVCSPDLLRQNINESPKYQDSITLNEASDITAYADPDENIVWVKGMVIKGLKTSLLKRRQQFVRHKKWYIAPNMESVTLINEADLHRLTEYHDECAALAARVKNNERGSWIDTKADIDDPQHSLLKLLVHRFKGASNFSDINLDKDLLVGKSEDDFFFPEPFVKTHLERLVYDLVDSNGMKVDVLELSQSKDYLLTRVMQQYADESLLYDRTVFNFSLAHPSPQELDVNVTSGLKEIHQVDFTSLQLPQVELLIFRAPESESTSDSDKLTENLFAKFGQAVRKDGFLLLVAKDPMNNSDIKDVMKQIGLRPYETVASKQLIEMARGAGFELISLKFFHKSIIPLMTILFKKTDKINPEKECQLHLGLLNYKEWLPLLRQKLNVIKEDPEARLWLIPDINECHTSLAGATGLLGFVKSLRLEPGYKNLRCLIDLSLTDARADIHDAKYGNLLERDLAYNIWLDDKTQWVQLDHLSMPRSIEEDTSIMERMEHVYLKTMKPGDLTSFTWTQMDIKSVPAESLATVYFAPLNFRDIMFATGRLAPEAIPGIPADVAQDSILGLEFSGKDVNGNRVMGVVPYKAIATSVVMCDPELVWPIPDHWTMEEASTVPCVYATAYYALLIRGSLLPKESVLIHAGAGGVGMAAIRICLSKGCRVFTTVGSPAKRQFLLKQFPSLAEGDILYSRDTSFEEHVMRLTDGRGVDIVLNSLAEEQLQAGLRCLAPSGRFLEIGKVDFIQDNPLYSYEMHKNRSFHGVLLDSLFKYSDSDYQPVWLMEEKRRLKKLVMQGIEEGTVRPLPRTVFSKEAVEEAFRFMSSGKHIGKVVLKIREEQQEEPVACEKAIIAVKKSYFDSDKSYIVIGGLGGFGLEVVNWLAGKGARKIVIAARRGIREPYQEFCVNRLVSRGVKLVIAHDPSYTEEGVTSILNKANQLGPVGGIFNAAVVYNDVLFENMTVEQFEQVLQPKLIATVHFDQLTRSMCPKLDYFVAFSSISCGRGNGGQSNYNFANSAMDSICEIRHRQGLPGLSIQWGVIGDVGIITEKTGGSTEVVLLGATSQRCYSLLESMDRFLQSGSPVCLSYVKAEKAGNSSGESVDLLKMVSRIFGIKDISGLEAGATLGSLGIDSLIAVEMKQLLERVTGESMSVKEIREINISTLIELSKSQVKAQTAAN